MADNKQQQLTIWGRANSVNVQKVLWCLSELDLAYDRIDAGMQFGKNNEAPYLAMNPNGRIPTLVDGDFVLWESNSVMRYLCLAYGRESPIYPARQSSAPPSTAGWTGRCRRCSRSTGRCSGRWCERQWKSATWSRSRRMSMRKPWCGGSSRRKWRARRFIEGDQFTIADIALGAFARRWFGVEGVTKPTLPNLERWFAQISERARIQAVHRAADDVSDSVAQREPVDAPAPILTAPPIFTQVSVPSTFTNPAPYAAHELPDAAPFNGSSLPEAAALSDFRVPGCSASAAKAGSISGYDRAQGFSHPAFYRLTPFGASGRT